MFKREGGLGYYQQPDALSYNNYLDLAYFVSLTCFYLQMVKMSSTMVWYGMV